MQHLALSKAIPKPHDLGLLFGMGGAEFGRVANSIQMGDHTPAPTKTLTKLLQGPHHGGPIQGGLAVEDGFKATLIGREGFIHLPQDYRNVLLYLVRGDGAEFGETLSLEKG
jgi:hypothetical protein